MSSTREAILRNEKCVRCRYNTLLYLFTHRHNRFYPKRRFQRIVYRILIFIADTLEDIFWNPTEPKQDITNVCTGKFDSLYAYIID